MKELRIGMIGYGFMGKAHSNAYAQANHFFPCEYKPVLKALCARNADKAKSFAANWGYESIETDWRKLLERSDIDAVDICTPNNIHKEIGRIFHYRANFLQDWTINADVPQGGAATWRLDAEAAGSGVTGDLLAHCIDTAIWLNGSIKDVSAVTETFVKERMHAETGKMQSVGIDDACSFFCHFGNGSLGLFESTRYARGHKALYTLEINGEHASIAWDLHDLHRLKYFDHSDESIVRGWRSIHVSDGNQPYMGNWWVPGLQIGYEHSFIHQVADFLKSLETGEPAHPSFRDALETQRVCDAVLSSAKTRQWADV